MVPPHPFLSCMGSLGTSSTSPATTPASKKASSSDTSTTLSAIVPHSDTSTTLELDGKKYDSPKKEHLKIVIYEKMQVIKQYYEWQKQGRVPHDRMRSAFPHLLRSSLARQQVFNQFLLGVRGIYFLFIRIRQTFSKWCLVNN